MKIYSQLSFKIFSLFFIFIYKKKIELAISKRLTEGAPKVDANGKIQKDKGDKYKQIKKFVEIIDGLLRKNPKITSSKKKVNRVAERLHLYLVNV